MKTLNIIGCGNLGKTLAHLWHKHSVFKIQDVITRSQKTAKEAVSFIGEGDAICDLSSIREADYYLIATPDDSIMNVCQKLQDKKILKAGDIVFQCSGSLSSSLFKTIVSPSVDVASIHPVKSFAEPQFAIQSFLGTYCGSEGDKRAIEKLSPAFLAIGGELFPINGEKKTEYHSAGVIVCNYLTVLLEAGIRVYSEAGVPEETTLKIIKPLVQETLDNNFKLGTKKALTGPIARGDVSVVERQLNSLNHWDLDIAALYKSLGCIAVELSKEQGSASEESIADLERLLRK